MSMISRNDYKRTLIHLMNYTNNLEYPREYQFTDTEFRQLTPEKIMRWVNVEAYGTPVPHTDANPIHARASSIMYYKRQFPLSFQTGICPGTLPGMRETQRDPHWSPTWSDVWNKKEVRGHGAPSQTTRPITELEYKNTMNIFCNSHQDSTLCNGAPGLINF